MVCVLSGDSSLFVPFTLVSFPGTSPGASRVSGRLARKGSDLLCRFEVDAIAELEIPPSASESRRRDELWRETCLEMFLGRPGEPEYWEVNLSPAGHWNVFRFPDYRQGKVEEAAFSFLPFLVLPESDRMTVDAVLDLASLGLAEEDIEVGLAAVLLSKAGETHYHALAHPRAAAGKPDFHHRDGWSLRLSALAEEDGDVPRPA